jgi:hypothetical protein
MVALHACRDCGIAFAGVKLLCIETGLADRSVRRALEDLVQRELIIVIGYPKGGRGRTTEYLVAPHVVPLSRGRCKLCGKDTSENKTLPQRQGFETKSKTLPQRQGFGETLPPWQGIEAERAAWEALNPATVSAKPCHSDHPRFIEPEPSIKQGGPRPPGSGSASPPSSDSTPQPTTAKDPSGDAEVIAGKHTHPVPNDEHLSDPEKP